MRTDAEIWALFAAASLRGYRASEGCSCHPETAVCEDADALLVAWRARFPKAQLSAAATDPDPEAPPVRRSVEGI